MDLKNKNKAPLIRGKGNQMKKPGKGNRTNHANAGRKPAKDPRDKNINIRLNSVDFPTFGRPTKAITGIIKRNVYSADSSSKARNLPLSVKRYSVLPSLNGALRTVSRHKL